MSDPNVSTVQQMEIRDQSITKVTVFNDRAEIKRLVKVDIVPGFNEIRLSNICEEMIHESLRVEGRGNAKIHDVVVKRVPVLNEEADSPKAGELRKKIEEELMLKTGLEDKISIIKKGIENIDRILGEVGGGLVNPPKEGANVELNDKTLEGLESLFKFYEKKSESMRVQMRTTERELEMVKERGQKAQNELARMLTPTQHARSSQIASITLESTENGSVEIDVIYQTRKTSWSPSYDIRVDTMNTSMTITYYGKIRQYTGEDWNSAPLVLSTAQPCLGGNIPKLGTLNASFYSEPAQFNSFHSHEIRHHPQFAPQPQTGAALFGAAAPMRAMAAPAPPPPMEVSVASEVKQNTLSAEFKIVRESSIPTGTDDHKVTIGIIKLIPKLVHESVPSKNAAAFLTASALNSSEFALLAGQASVFLNNAFVAKTQLKNVSPGERFSCSLGVDTAIRVEYKPAKKYHEEAGYITKHSSNVTEQVIGLKNTRTEQSVLLTIKHHVPRSTDEKIRVKLLSPNTEPYNPNTQSNDSDEHEPVEGSKYNSNHNLEWTVRLNGGESKDLSIKWCVEHPKEERVVYREEF